MTDAQTLAWTEAERLDLTDYLGSLDSDSWQAPSLCPGWTVHDVAAHLTLSTRTTLGGVVVGMFKARGDIHRMIATQARERAARYAPAELVAQLRETAGSPRRAPGTGALDPLVDALVHGQDIARALGHVRPMPPEAVVAALEYAHTARFYAADQRFRDARLIATDLDWEGGHGPNEVRGPAADLLLVATGRAAGLAGLSGAGVERVSAAL